MYHVGIRFKAAVTCPNQAGASCLLLRNARVATNTRTVGNSELMAEVALGPGNRKSEVLVPKLPVTRQTRSWTRGCAVHKLTGHACLWEPGILASAVDRCAGACVSRLRPK